jgi:hypothetical protein
MELRHLRYFVAVTEDKSIRVAARGQDQSPVLDQVAQRHDKEKTGAVAGKRKGRKKAHPSAIEIELMGDRSAMVCNEEAASHGEQQDRR